MADQTALKEHIQNLQKGKCALGMKQDGAKHCSLLEGALGY